MKYSKIFAAWTITTLIALSGCAAPTDGDENVGESSEEALTLTRPITPAECRAFYDRHPHTGSVTLSTGDVVGTPFVACDVNSAAIFGTMDLSFARELLAGTGYVPLTVQQFGKPATALARLYFIDYLNTDLGPYSEFIFLVDAAPENSSIDQKTLTVVNPISTLLPAFDPKARTYIHRLVLQKQATKAIAYGREILGLDKRAGAVDIVQGSNGRSTFSVKDEHGASIVHGAFRPDQRVTTLLGTMAKLVAAAVGELVTPADLSLKLHPLQLNQAIEVSANSFSRDPANGGAIANSKLTNWWFPTMNDATASTLDFQLDTSSELGKKLSDAHFTPKALVTSEHVSVTFERQ